MFISQVVLSVCCMTLLDPSIVLPQNDQVGAAATATRFVHEFPAMGVEFRVVAYTTFSSDADQQCKQLKQQIEDRVQYLESVLSNYRDDSEVSRISATAPHRQPVVVSHELFHLCRRSQHFHQMTDGAFDPTIGAVSKIWRFARNRNRIPDDAKIAAAMASVGWQSVRLAADDRIALQRRGTELDFGGIAKGYAADQIIKLLEQRSITSALVDAGGDIRVSAAPKETSGWKISTDLPSKGKLKLNLANVGVATSGATRQRLSFRGTSYSHIIDPRSGKPVTHHWNVTVIAADATSADALASAFSVLGKDRSLTIADASEQIFAMFANVQSGQIVYSRGIQKFLEP